MNVCLFSYNSVLQNQLNDKMKEFKFEQYAVMHRELLDVIMDKRKVECLLLDTCSRLVKWHEIIEDLKDHWNFANILPVILTCSEDTDFINNLIMEGFLVLSSTETSPSERVEQIIQMLLNSELELEEKKEIKVPVHDVDFVSVNVNFISKTEIISLPAVPIDLGVKFIKIKIEDDVYVDLAGNPDLVLQSLDLSIDGKMHDTLGIIVKKMDNILVIRYLNSSNIFQLVLGNYIMKKSKLLHSDNDKKVIN